MDQSSPAQALRSIGRTASSVGMMEGAFFVSRTELLAWVRPRSYLVRLSLLISRHNDDIMYNI